MLYTEGNAALGTLPDIPYIPENAGRYYQAISPRTMADATLHAIENAGGKDLNPRFSLTKDGSKMIGTVGMKLPASYPEIPDHEYSLAFIHAMDQSRALVMATGTHCFVCFNGMLTGDLILCRKHTIGLDLFDEVRNAVGRAFNQFRGVGETVLNLQSRLLLNSEVDSAFMEIGRQGILPWSAVGKAWNELQAPTHDYFKVYRNTAFGVYSATNEVIKQRNPVDQMAGLQKLTALLAA